MTHKMGAKGQVVVPKELRDRAGLAPGALNAELWTGDPEILELEDPGCRVRDLRG